MIERAINNLVFSTRCPVNRFTDIPFIMVPHRENAFGPLWDSSTVKPQADTGKHWKQG